MQSFDTKDHNNERSTKSRRAVTAGSVEDFPDGSRKTFELPEGRELVLFYVDGEFYAIDNFCPHKGAPLSEGSLCNHVIECDWHGWQFDVRTGECLTVIDRVTTYEVVLEDGWVKILI